MGFHLLALLYLYLSYVYFTFLDVRGMDGGVNFVLGGGGANKQALKVLTCSCSGRILHQRIL